MRNIIATVLISTLLIGGAAALASERKIAMKDLPPAVQQAIKDQGGATVRGLAKEVDKGKTLYEAELTVNGERARSDPSRRTNGYREGNRQRQGVGSREAD